MILPPTGVDPIAGSGLTPYLRKRREWLVRCALRTALDGVCGRNISLPSASDAAAALPVAEVAPKSATQRELSGQISSITTTLLRFGQFLAGNRFAKGKAARLSRAWAGRHEEVLKVPFLRSVVVILGLPIRIGTKADHRCKYGSPACARINPIGRGGRTNNLPSSPQVLANGHYPDRRHTGGDRAGEAGT